MNNPDCLLNALMKIATYAEFDSKGCVEIAHRALNQWAGNATCERFEDFWKVYPNKRDKKKALEVWKRRKLDADADEIIKDIRARKRMDDIWKNGYVPLPTTYLRGDRWEDEYGKR